jgi:homoserine dehydrogenase
VKHINVAIAGFGGVGRAVASLLLARRNRYRSLYHVDVRLVAVCGSRAGLSSIDGLEPNDFDRLIEGRSGSDFLLAARPDVLVEAGPSNFRTGGPGYNYIGTALDKGIHAIVISKGALVFDGSGLQDRARKTGAFLKVSGATAAALPTIDLLDYNLKGCEFVRIEGILNATTNFLLSSMMDDGVSYADALAKAQQDGFAESDPRNDTEGWDTAAKLLILANFGLDAGLTMDDVVVDGIQKVTEAQIKAWRNDGVVPKLIGAITIENATWKATVGVRMLPTSDIFSQVAGKNKAIRITTDTMGEIVAIGSGAEPMATASAALKDFEHILLAAR